nr:reverse transcriptase domain-containing protein [Tanacetum cinerariifolium]
CGGLVSFGKKESVVKKIISGLKNAQGEWVYDKGGIGRLVRDHFQSIYMTNDTRDFEDVISVLDPVVFETMNIHLQLPVTNSEIHKATKQLGGLKASGDDGFHDMFYQKYWNFLGVSASGQTVNFEKSYAFFSPNTTSSLRDDICGNLHIHQMDSKAKYLGLPSMFGKKKVEMFGLLLDRVLQKMKVVPKRCDYLHCGGRFLAFEFLIVSLLWWNLLKTIIPIPGWLWKDVLLDDFTLMLTPKSNSDVTSPRSNNLSTSNHVSLDSRHWSPSSGGLRSGLCLYVIALKYGIAYTMCIHALFVYLKKVREVIGIEDREVTRYKANLEDRARREEELFTRASLSSVESKKLKHMRKSRFHASLNGRGGPIAPIAIQGMNFGLKNDMIQQVQHSCQFHGLPGDDANKHLNKFLHVTQSMKVNGVTDDALYLYLFPHSLTHHSTAWFDHLPRNSINTFEQMAKMFLEKYFPPSMVTKLRNEIPNIRQRLDESFFEAWECYKLSIDRCLNRNMFPVTQIDTFYNGLTLRHRDTINAAAGGTFMKRRPEECYDLIENMTAHHNNWDISA